MGDGILDYVTDNWQSLLGMGSAQAADNPPQPPTAPPQVMAGAPASFAPNSTFDQNVPGPRPGAPPLSFADRAAPVQQAIKNGTFDQVGGSQTSFAPQPDTPPMMRDVAGNGGGMPGSPLAFAGASPPPVPPPSDSNAAPPATPGGGLATSLGISPEAMRGGDLTAFARAEMAKRLGVSPDVLEAAGRERMRRDALNSTFKGVGEGLKAVGQLRPGATGAAAFAAGAGGSLAGTADAQKSAQNDLFNQTSTAFKDMMTAEKLGNDKEVQNARIRYLDSLAQMKANGLNTGRNAWVGHEYGRAMEIERRMLQYREQLRKEEHDRMEATGKKGSMTDEEYDASKKRIEDAVGARRKELQQQLGVSDKTSLMGTDPKNPFDWDKLTPQQRQQLPGGSYVRYKAKPGDPKADKDGYRLGIAPQPQKPQQPQQQQPSAFEVENNLGAEEALG